MKAAGIGGRWIEGIANAHGHLVAGDDRLEQRAGCGFELLGQRQCRRNDRDPRMQRRLGRHVVELDRVRGGAVGQRGPDGSSLVRRAKDVGFA